MKLPWVVALCIVFVACQLSAAENIQLKTQKQKMSYIMGTRLGNNLKAQKDKLDREIAMQGIKDALSGAKPLMTEKDMAAVIEADQKERAARQAEAFRLLAEKNKKEAEAFLAENAKKEGVITLPSGLQYKVITEGKGKRPMATDKVIVNFRGSLIDGKVFDDSNEHERHPEVVPVSGLEALPAGWTEGLQLMNEGSKWQLFVPPSLGYQDKRSLSIPPNSVLIIEVELVAIEKAKNAEETKIK